MKPRSVEARESKVEAINALAKPMSQKEERAEEPDDLDEILSLIINFLVKKDKTGITPSMFKYLGLPAKFSGVSKDDVWAQMIEKKLLIPDKGDGKAVLPMQNEITN